MEDEKYIDHGISFCDDYALRIEKSFNSRNTSNDSPDIVSLLHEFEKETAYNVLTQLKHRLLLDENTAHNNKYTISLDDIEKVAKQYRVSFYESNSK